MHLRQQPTHGSLVWRHTRAHADALFRQAGAVTIPVPIGTQSRWAAWSEGSRDVAVGQVASGAHRTRYTMLTSLEYALSMWFPPRVMSMTVPHMCGRRGCADGVSNPPLHAWREGFP